MRGHEGEDDQGRSEVGGHLMEPAVAGARLRAAQPLMSDATLLLDAAGRSSRPTTWRSRCSSTHPRICGGSVDRLLPQALPLAARDPSEHPPPRRDDDGRPLSWFGQFQDITGRRRQEQELRWVADHELADGSAHTPRLSRRSRPPPGEAPMDLGRLALRSTVGPLFVGHGTQKLFGWFGGHGLDGTGGFFETLGLRPGKRHATAAGASEAIGGALLTLGALTPVAAGMVTGTMITAIRKVHVKNGPWVTDNGYEYNLVLIASMLALAESGPGRPSVDEAAFPWMKGNGLALAQFAVAAAGSYLVTEHFSEAEAEAPAPNEGDAGLPGDPAAASQNRFTREESEIPSGS